MLCSSPLATELHTHWAMLCWWLPAAALGRQDQVLAMTPGVASKQAALMLLQALQAGASVTVPKWVMACWQAGEGGQACSLA